LKELDKEVMEATKEIQDMNTWYKDWFGKDIPKGRTILQTVEPVNKPLIQQ